MGKMLPFNMVTLPGLMKCRNSMLTRTKWNTTGQDELVGWRNMYSSCKMNISENKRTS